MSLTARPVFDVDSLPLDPIDGGTSILLTGEDSDAVASVFYRLVGPADGERAVVLATEDRGRTVQRRFDDAVTGSGSRTDVLTAKGPASAAGVTAIDDITDLTTVGMEFSTLVATAQQESERLRSGILLCSSICGAIDDTRSVYRFLNSNFLTELRRNKGLGVVALDCSADLGADVDGIVAGMKTSFTAHVDVTDATATGATLTVSGLGDGEQTVDVSL